MAQKHKPLQLKKWEDENLEGFEISPDLYTHLTIIEALKAMPKGLETGNADNGLVALVIAVDQLEQILKARNLLHETDEYHALVKQKTEKLGNSLIEQGQLANFKLGLLFKITFDTTTKDAELTL